MLFKTIYLSVQTVIYSWTYLSAWLALILYFEMMVLEETTNTNYLEPKFKKKHIIQLWGNHFLKSLGNDYSVYWVAMWITDQLGKLNLWIDIVQRTNLFLLGKLKIKSNLPVLKAFNMHILQLSLDGYMLSSIHIYFT